MSLLSRMEAVERRLGPYVTAFESLRRQGVTNKDRLRELSDGQGGGGGGGGATNLICVLTPAGGIPARAALVMGSATCEIYNEASGTLSDSLTTTLVYNPFPTEAGSNQYRLALGDGANYVLINETQVRKAKTGGAVIAVASSTRHPTGATVTLCDWNSGTGQWDTNGRTVTAYNPSATSTVAANQYVTLNWVDAIWEIILEPC